MAEINKDCKAACCQCSYPCPRHGDCKACMDYHRKTGSLTNCGKTGKETNKQ